MASNRLEYKLVQVLRAILIVWVCFFFWVSEFLGNVCEKSFPLGDGDCICPPSILFKPLWTWSEGRVIETFLPYN